MPGGRPTDYTPEMGDFICENISKGISLARMCEPEEMPAPSTIYRWRRLHPEFSKNYAHAREDQADRFADDILEIADEAEPETVQVAKLRTDTRKWLASNFNRAYQPKSQQELSGPNGGPIGVRDMSSYSDEELEKIASGELIPK